MGVYLFCIAPEGHRPPQGCLGLDDRPVHALDAPRLSLWVCDAPARPEPTLERIKRHNRVVEAAADETVTPVPVRFGQWMDSPEALARSVLERREHYLQALARFAGALEFGVRVLRPDPAPALDAAPATGPAGAGRAYLERRARAFSALQAGHEDPEVAAALEAHLDGFVLETRRDLSRATAHSVLAIAHLVRRHEISVYRSGLDEFRHRRPDLRFLVSGPWPPYSFVV